MENEKIINWLREGDVSIQYQVHRDLFSVHREDLRNRIASEGWGFKLMRLKFHVRSTLKFVSQIPACRNWQCRQGIQNRRSLIWDLIGLYSPPLEAINM